ncbi:hypothetical protein PIB30_036200 [Stylosanthes scabra]|uniref:Uncharacterized protein n=1 Tax=Stylosanthes scabra TaxID=79078 RepID=A0ABU6SD63_9FABA|nr:hypothetical protein [Stylosanthes scabra]
MELPEDMNPVHNNEQHQQQKQKVNEKQIPSPLDLLSNYASSFIRLSGTNLLRVRPCGTDPQKKSTEDIIRIAGVKYLQYSSQSQNNYFQIPEDEENKDVQLAQFLFAALERIVCRQFEHANSLLLHCCHWNYGNSVQRTIFHFSQALRERIKQETGSGMATIPRLQRNPIEELQRDHNAAVACHKKLPFNQVMQFVGLQTIIEYLASHTKIHMIDLALGYGLMAATLMEALAGRQENPVELLKITAVVYGDSRGGVIDETGKRLVSLGESLNLRFLFKTVFVRDINELDTDDFEVEKDEAVVVYSPNFLRTLISFPDSLDKLMRVIKKIKPGLMIVLEVEANHNSISFVNRFIESLFFFSALFDCIETCLNQDDESRMRVETILSEGIRNIVAFDERERILRNVKIDVWRKFFTKLRMQEIKISESSVYQGNLVVKKLGLSDICTIEKQGKCLILGWKGTPIHSISAWKFI